MILEAKNIYKTYSNGKKTLPVLNGIDLEIKEGQFIVIVGPSGAGKSTLLHILGGLDSPSQGKVLFKKHDIYKLSEAALGKIRNGEIGFVFQFYHLLSEFTVLENVMMPALIGKEGKIRGEKRALELLENVGLKDRIAHFPAQLSGGEKQRAAMARALVNSPSLLLCDEPTGNLDSATGEGIIELMKKTNRQNQMTLVVVTHNTELAKKADAVYHLKDGVLAS